ncbi:unnamed protein product [Malus baccata var. baccata]
MTLGSKAGKEQSECPPPCKPHQVHTHRTFSVLPQSGVDVSSPWVANRHVRQVYSLSHGGAVVILGDGFEASFCPDTCPRKKPREAVCQVGVAAAKREWRSMGMGLGLYGGYFFPIFILLGVEVKQTNSIINRDN